MAPNPEEIQVSLSLADGDAMQSFINAVNQLTEQMKSAVTQVGGGTGGGQLTAGNSGIADPNRPAATPPSAGPAGSPVSAGASNLTPAERQEKYGELYAQQYAAQEDSKAMAQGQSAYERSQQSALLQVPGVRPVAHYGQEIRENYQEGQYLEAATGLYGGYKALQGAAYGVSPFLPNTAQSAGQSYGLSGSPTSIGPFQSPLPFGLPGIADSPAASEYYGNMFDAATAMFEPGVTYGGEQNINTMLEETGWHGARQDVLENAMTQLNKDVGGEGILDPGVTASMIDQATRLGQYPLEDFINTLKTVPETARAANMSVAEFQQQLDQVGNALQERGLTYGQGVQAANRFSGVTNQSPLVGQQLMDNQFIQANLMGKYGLLPEQQGLIFGGAQGAFTDTALDTISQMRELYKGTFPSQNVKVAGQNIKLSSKEQIDPLIAKAMDMTPEELRSLERNQKRERIQSDVGTLAEQYNRDVGSLHDLLDSGKIGKGRFDNQMENLRAGTGRYAGPNAVSWNEVMEQMQKKHSGFTDEQIAEASNVKTASERSAYIRNIIQEQGRKSDTVGKEDGQTLDLTPAAKKLVKFLEDTGAIDHERERRSARAGQSNANEAASDSTTYRPSAVGPAAGAISSGVR